MRKVVWLLAALSAMGQSPPAATTGADDNLALVRFQVEPRKDNPVASISPEDIEIRVDGKPQQIALFLGGHAYPHTVPIELTLLFDCDPIALSSGALDPRVFQEGLLDEFPNLSVAIYGFTSRIVRRAALTRNQEELNKALGSPMFVHPVSTFLLDHIRVLAQEISSTPGHAIRMLAIFSERQPERGSTTSAAEQDRHRRMVEVARETGVYIYPIRLIAPLALQTMAPTPLPERTDNVPGPQFTPADPSPEWRAMGDFTNLGAATGGKRFEIPTGGNMLPIVLDWIAEQIRHEYVVGFQLPASGEKKRHKVKVVMRNKARGRISGGERTLVY